MKPVELVPRTFHPQLEQTSHTSVTPPPNFDPRVMQNYLADCRSEQFDQRRFVHSNLTDYDRLPHNNLDDSYTSEHNNNDLMGRIDSDSENLIEIEYESQPPVPPTSFRSQPQNLLQEVHSASNVGLLIDIDDNNQLSTPTHSAGTAVAISQSTDVNAIGSCPPCLPKADQSQVSPEIPLTIRILLPLTLVDSDTANFCRSSEQR